ncbi:cysteine hydrolase family protein [Acidovorax sp. LjRoot194]|uniref:cysteine hydrolase family protein n=1 Tax=Acidovorax sp. LjRoot194 TaxID=3342280 RepID=UPI003ECEF35F
MSSSDTPLSPLNLRRTALVIIDLQDDFLAPEGAYARGGAVSAAAQALPPRVAAVAQALKAAGGMVVGSQFTLWPDAQGEPMISPHLKTLRPFLRRGDFAPGSAGQAMVSDIAPWVDVAVCKVAYSAFFNTQLDWVLRRAGIDTVAVCGIVTNGGVASTVRDAHMRDYRTLVLSDGCAAFRREVHDTALADMATVAQVLTCNDFTAALAAGTP